MKHTKLYSILLFSILSSTCSAVDFSQETKAQMDAAIALFDDSNAGSCIRRFLKIQDTLAKHTALRVNDETVVGLCKSLTTGHFESSVGLAMAYIKAIGLESLDLTKQVADSATLESKWLKIMGYMTLQLFSTVSQERATWAQAFIRDVSNIKTRPTSLADFSEAMHDGMSDLSENAKALLSRQSYKQEKSGVTSVTAHALHDSEVGTMLYYLNEGITKGDKNNIETARAIAMLELYLDYVNEREEKTSKGLNMLGMACGSGLMTAIWTLGAGAAILSIIDASNEETLNFYKEIFPKCGAFLCPTT